MTVAPEDVVTVSVLVTSLVIVDEYLTRSSLRKEVSLLGHSLKRYNSSWKEDVPPGVEGGFSHCSWSQGAEKDERSSSGVYQVFLLLFLLLLCLSIRPTFQVGFPSGKPLGKHTHRHTQKCDCFGLRWSNTWWISRSREMSFPRVKLSWSVLGFLLS